MLKKLEIKFDMENNIFYPLSVSEVREEVNPLFISRDNLLILPTIEHNEVVVCGEEKRLAFDNGIIKMIVYTPEEIYGQEKCRSLVEDEMVRKMIEITRDMSNTLCNIANKLEDEFLE